MMSRHFTEKMELSLPALEERKPKMRWPGRQLNSLPQDCGRIRLINQLCASPPSELLLKLLWSKIMMLVITVF